jgi:hypothetical protein
MLLAIPDEFWAQIGHKFYVNPLCQLNDFSGHDYPESPITQGAFVSGKRVLFTGGP